MPGASVLTSLHRNYRYNIVLSANGAGTNPPVLTTVSVTPASATVTVGNTQAFVASGRDQYGGTIAAAVDWTVSGGGTISSAGVFTASAVGGPFTVTATSTADGSISGTAAVTVGDGTPVPSGNLALGRPVVASSQESGSLSPDKAVDGNPLTRWASASGADPQWLYVDLGAVYPIDRVVLNWERAYGKAYQVQVSDTASSWSTVYTESNGNGAVDDIGFSATSARYVRIYGTQRGTQWGYSLWELQVFGEGGGTAVSGIGNGSFELDTVAAKLVTTSLTDWSVTSGNVELLPASVYVPPLGNQSLDLNGTQPGTIRQVVTGLNPNALYTLYVSYADQSARGTVPELVTADIYVNATKIGAIRTTQNAPTFITCNGYEFTSSSSGTAAVDIVSTAAGQYGAVIDDVRLVPGGLPLPPESGAVVNGSFETPVGGDPHLCGDQLPGWRVTQENVDIVGSGTWPAFDGIRSLDLSGHGPGGIAQTVTGLTPGHTYTFSFGYARHLFWGTAPLTADVIVNGVVVAQLTATTANYPTNWLTMSLPVVAPADGKITLGFKSTATDTGGGVIVDDIKLSP
jgi:hypothetical protein